MKTLFPLFGFLILLSGCGAVAERTPRPDRLVAKVYDSGFPQAHASFNGISSASDGRIYYVLSSGSLDIGGQMYSFNPATAKVEHLGDLTEMSGEKGAKAVPQGKSHVNFIESAGKLYFATHLGYYVVRDGVETVGAPPAGYKPYPGGHLLVYDMATRRSENLAAAPNREGIITMNMDAARGRIYFITWPSGQFYRYDLRTKEIKDFGTRAEDGERDKGRHYQTICRSIAVNPDDGSAFFTNARGTIFRYRYDSDSVAPVESDNLVKDYFGRFDPTLPGSMGYHWRQTVWHRPDRSIYGVHGNSGYLFRFDPARGRVELLDRITSEPSRRSGMFDKFQYGYLGFTLGPDGHTLHYLTGGPIYENGVRVAGKQEDLRLVTYDLATSGYRDHGPIFLENGERPASVNNIAVGKDGTVYALSRVAGERGDLIAIPGPFK